MVMRWLMRGVCLLLLAGVVGVGVGSYAGLLVTVKHAAGRYWGVGAVQGLGYMILAGERGVHLTTPLKFSFVRGDTAERIGLPPRTLGFFGGRYLAFPDARLIIFPLWLPAVLLVVLNGFVWRWTRRRAVGAVGFPVEPAKEAEA